ncbi:flavocytochrome c [Treponema sp. OMZ 840]|uniref:flavocytochrome c n=1 Tax=Treponema sp. OMZ 840 TaxID=244313 RepID=UPI003D8C94F5
MKKSLCKLGIAVLIVFSLFFIACKDENKFKAGTYTGEGSGMAGPVTVEVKLSESKIESVRVVKHNETAGISDPALVKIPEQIVALQKTKVDVVAGCSITSRAIAAGTEAALKAAGADIAKLNKAASDVKKAKTASEEKRTDVVVVGSGGAGIAAALAAAENGAKVILLEKMSSLGGATRLSGGIIPAVGTKQQVEAGIADNNDWFARDILRPSNYSVRQDLVYTVVENSKSLIEWMESMGCRFTLVTNALYYGQSNYRMHRSEGSGAGMTETLIKYLEGVGAITVMRETAGTGLITNKAGEVIGVTASDGKTSFNIYANNTVLATSGFGANDAMLKEYMPEVAAAFKYVAPGATGEGILWGQKLGAAVANMKAYQGHAFFNEQIRKSLSQGMANMGGIFVNTNGVRFTNEYGGYSELTPHVLAQPGHFAYLIINKDIANATSAFAGYKENGIVVSGNTAESLAAELGIDAAALADTFERYKASIKRGEDEFNKTKLPKNWDGPYYAMKITGDLRHTQGGLVTDIDTHVLKKDGSVIQGLYAAGGCTEGFASTGGAAYMSGDGLLQALIYGRIAGTKAATEKKGSIKATVWQGPSSR